LSETLSETRPKKYYTNYGAKRMVIILGQAKNYKPPPQILGQNVGETIIKKYW